MGELNIDSWNQVESLKLDVLHKKFECYIPEILN